MSKVLTQIGLELYPTRTTFIEDTGGHSDKMCLSRFEKTCVLNGSHRCRSLADRNMLAKCFKMWKKNVYKNKNKLIRLDEQIQQSEKLEKFIRSLKEVQTQLLKRNEKNGENKLRQKFNNESQVMHRFRAQKNIIEIQKKKLREQNNLINQLKLGILEETVNESIVQVKQNMTDILQNCTVKVKCNVTSSVFLENVHKDLIEFGIKSNKVPKIIREMKERAKDREQRRQVISERKKVIDASRKKALKDEILEKRSLDEEKRKLCMEELQKRREAQLKFYRQAKLNREKTLQDTAKAKDLYEKCLKKRTFVVLCEVIRSRRNNFIKGVIHSEMKLKRRGFKYWKQFFAEVEYRRNYNVTQLYTGKIKRRLFFGWYKMYTLSIQHVQVAQDFYAAQLENKIFNRWHRYTCIQHFLERNNIQKASRHYQNWMLLHYFYQWKSLPAIVAIERAKEEKKRKWREKVWEIVPDYRPTNDDSFS